MALEAVKSVLVSSETVAPAKVEAENRPLTFVPPVVVPPVVVGLAKMPVVFVPPVLAGFVSVGVVSAALVLANVPANEPPT